MIPVIVCVVLAFAGEVADTSEASALQYAKEFTKKFVRESCVHSECKFVPEDSKISRTPEGNLTVELSGKRRLVSAEHVEEKRVTALLTLKPLETGADLPHGMVVLDFRFIEGKEISNPTK